MTFPYHENANAYFSKIIHINENTCIVKSNKQYGLHWEVEIQTVLSTDHFRGDTAKDALEKAGLDWKILKDPYPEIFI